MNCNTTLHAKGRTNSFGIKMRLSALLVAGVPVLSGLSVQAQLGVPNKFRTKS
jgi:hypothetical protein